MGSHIAEPHLCRHLDLLVLSLDLHLELPEAQGPLEQEGQIALVSPENFHPAQNYSSWEASIT